jgi:hypothetical protein
MVRTQISIAGLSEERAAEGIPDLLEELHARPWLRQPSVTWDPRRQRLVVTVAREGANPEIRGGDGGANYDEVSDCIWATYTFPELGIELHVDESRMWGLPN